MNVVLYTRDMEPITVIDLPLWALEIGERRQVLLQLAVLPELRLMAESEPHPMDQCHTISLEFHRLVLPGGRPGWIVMVDDELLALQLRPSWLPGQRGRANEYERTTRQLSKMLLAKLSRGMGGH